MSDDHYSALISLGFMTLSLLFLYALDRDTKVYVHPDEKETSKEINKLSLNLLSAVSSIAVLLKILVVIQAFSLIKSFF